MIDGHTPLVRFCVESYWNAGEPGEKLRLGYTKANGGSHAETRRCTIDISINKAYTARAFDIPTKDLAKESEPGKQFYGIHVSNRGRVMIFAGGIPLKHEGKVVGAIGVSGGTGDQDQSVAEAGAEAFQTGR